MLVAAALVAALSPDVASAAVDQVHYTFTGPRSVAFDWRGNETDIHYGTTTSYEWSATASVPDPLPFSSPGPFREVELTGLEPGTTYHYSIGGGPDATFTTAPSGAFRFDAIADSGSSLKYPCTGPATPPAKCPMIATQAQVAADDPDFVLAIGDLSYGDEDGLPAVDQHFNDVMPWSRTAAYMPAWGNHEWEASPVVGDDLSNYKGRFSIPNGQASAGLPAHQWCCGEDWGWFDAGGVRFVSYPEPYAGGSTGTLPDWYAKADAVVAAAQADENIRYIVTFGHQPAYSTGSHSGVARLALYLGQFGDRYSKYVLNLNGHSHDYERFQPIHGVTHMTAAGGGSELGVWSASDPRTVQKALNLERVRIDVGTGGMHVQTICGPPRWAQLPCAEDSVIDEFTIAAPRPAPVVTLTRPADGSVNPEQTFAGTAGTATGDSRTVTVDVHEGESTTGPLAWTASPTVARSTSTSVPDTTTGTWSVSAVPVLGDGTYTAVVRQTSSNGDAASQARTFQVDTTAPSSSASVAPASGPGALYVSWSAADAGPSGLAEVELWARPPGAAGYERVDAEGQPGPSGAFEYAPSAGEGTYGFFTRARDRAGNVELAPGRPDAETSVTGPRAPEPWTPAAPVDLVLPTPVVAAPPLVPPTPVVPAPPLAFAVTTPARHDAGAVIRNGLPVRLKCSAACKYGMELSVSRATARKLKLRRAASAVTISRATGSIAAPGEARARLRLAATVRRALRRRRTRIKVTLGTVVAYPGGARAGSQSLGLQLVP